MNRKTSQGIDIHTTESGFEYHRGSALSVFKGDRREDLIALIFAFLIAMGVWAHVNLGWGLYKLLGLT